MSSDSSVLPRRTVEAARGQFDSTLKMLKTFVEVCPQEVWEGYFFGFEYPVWYQVFHSAFFIDLASGCVRRQRVPLHGV